MGISARAFVTLANHVFLLFSTLCLLLRHLCQAVSLVQFPIAPTAGQFNRRTIPVSVQGGPECLKLLFDNVLANRGIT